MISLWKNTSPDVETEEEVRSRCLRPDERRHLKIKRIAYFIWIDKGGGNGHALEDWIEATAQVDEAESL